MNSSTTSDGVRPTIVFVHGAWADASGFDGSIRALHSQGYRTIGVANPLRALGSDAAYLDALLKTVEGPMVLVAHSYGGAVISNAATGNDQVKALVFLAGWALDEGESIDPETARVMAATQRPWSAAALGAPSGPPAWKSIPSWYLLGTEDMAIPPATQRFMAERATSTIEEVSASHASMVSQPDVATKLIITAVNATAGATA
jgi:pimeloyl-ACP methyl ester carboxylesterase